jgi:predicted GNAT superfamily acetyltransferase
MSGDVFEIRPLDDVDELSELVEVLGQVWGTDTAIVSLEMARAISSSGGYVAAAFEPRPGSTRRMVGASVGILARHRGQEALHSHVTGLLPDVRGSGLGRAIKLHQRSWAAERGIEWITWTFDPLVRRNAWFNIAVLGAGVHAYLTDFYGTMTDAINAGDTSDRLHVEWPVAGPLPDQPRDGHDAAGPTTLVSTPEDVVALRRTDPEAVGRWRAQTRAALTTALDAGDRVLGFTRAGDYVIGSGR